MVKRVEIHLVHPFELTRAELGAILRGLHQKVTDRLKVKPEQVEITYHPHDEPVFTCEIKVIGPRVAPSGLEEDYYEAISSVVADDYDHEIEDPDITTTGGVDVIFRVKADQDRIGATNFEQDLRDQTRREIARILDLGKQRAQIEVNVDFAYGCEVDQVVLNMVQRDDEPEETIMALLATMLAIKLLLRHSEVDQEFNNLDPAVAVRS